MVENYGGKLWWKTMVENCGLIMVENYVREPNQQGFQRSRAMGGETHFFHPSTDTKQEIAVMCESTCPVVMADAHL